MAPNWMMRCGVLAAVWLAGCAESPESADTVAQVGDAILTENDLRAALPMGAMAGGPERVADARQQLIHQWMDRELLYQEALVRDMDEQPRLKTLIEEAERDLLAAALIDAEFGGQETSVEDSEIRRYYEEHIADFQRPSSEIRARHILLASRRDANARLQALQHGESFESLADEYSLDADTRFRGGDLGFFSEEEEPELWAACEDLPVDKVSNPIRTEYGYHLFQVLDRQKAGTVRPISQVRGEIIEALVRQRQQGRLDSLLKSLRDRHDWKIMAVAADTA